MYYQGTSIKLGLLSDRRFVYREPVTVINGAILWNNIDEPLKSQQF